MTEARNVYMIKRNGKPYRWVVKITVKGERVYIGCFNSEEKATTALKVARAKVIQ